MRCRLCGAEASRFQEGDGYAWNCPRCGPHWISCLIVRTALYGCASQLSAAVHELNAAGRGRVKLRSNDDIARVIGEAEELLTHA